MSGLAVRYPEVKLPVAKSYQKPGPQQPCLDRRLDGSSDGTEASSPTAEAQAFPVANSDQGARAGLERIESNKDKS